MRIGRVLVCSPPPATKPTGLAMEFKPVADFSCPELEGSCYLSTFTYRVTNDHLRKLVEKWEAAGLVTVTKREPLP